MPVTVSHRQSSVPNTSNLCPPKLSEAVQTKPRQSVDAKYNLQSFDSYNDIKQPSSQLFKPVKPQGKTFYQGGKKQFAKNSNKQKLLIFELLSEQQFAITFKNFFSKDLVSSVRTLKVQFDEDSKAWIVPIKLRNQFISVVTEVCTKEGITLVDVPKFVYTILTAKVPHLNFGRQFSRYCDDGDRSVESLPQTMLGNMYQFQKEGVQFGVSKFGRVLLGDEMGVGKTIQAIGIAYLYKSDWPLLVITPASLKYQWQDEILKWLPTIRQSDIQLFTKGSEPFNCESLIFIMSYQLAAKRSEELQQLNFKIVIGDEAHYLKSRDSQRSKNLMPILEQAKRLVLMSGTPVLARPMEIYNIIRVLRPDVCPSFSDFAKRYCDPKTGRYGVDYSGASCTFELHHVLTTTFMVRRLKRDVLDQLPDKRRQQVQIQTDDRIVRQLQKLQVGPNKGESAEDAVDRLLKGQIKEAEEDESNAFMQAYKLTGMSKIDGVCDFIETLVDNGAKFLVFAHHLCMLDALEEFASKKKFGYIRIDGQVPPEKRHDRVKDYQTKADIRLAILSITAASQGLTLTAASCVVFAELTWTPSIMAQAEDRAHRIGQKNSVNIYYLHAKGTLDDTIFEILKDKSLVTTGVTDGHKEHLNLKDQDISQINYEEIVADGTVELPQQAKRLKKPKKSVVQDFFQNRSRGQDTTIDEEISDDDLVMTPDPEPLFQFQKQNKVKNAPGTAKPVIVQVPQVPAAQSILSQLVSSLSSSTVFGKKRTSPF